MKWVRQRKIKYFNRSYPPEMLYVYSFIICSSSVLFNRTASSHMEIFKQICLSWTKVLVSQLSIFPLYFSLSLSLELRWNPGLCTCCAKSHATKALPISPELCHQATPSPLASVKSHSHCSLWWLSDNEEEAILLGFQPLWQHKVMEDFWRSVLLFSIK